MTWPHLAGDRPDAEKLGEGPNVYVPALTATTNPNLGADGVATGWWHRVGPNLVIGGARFLFSGTGLSAGSGPYRISLPLPADTSVLNASGTVVGGSIIGSGKIRDNDNPSLSTIVALQLTTASTVLMTDASGNTSISNNTPFTWSTSDRISVFFTYVVATGV